MLTTNDKAEIIDLTVDTNLPKVGKFIQQEIDSTNIEIETIEETIASIDKLAPQCDKIDYALAAGSGVLCGIIDIIFVGVPKASVLSKETEKWVDNCVKRFAKLKGWSPKKGETISSAIQFLGKEYKINYDQRGCGDSAGEKIFGITPNNHHFKSLGHNPTIVGLFFSILDQFTHQSHFISDGQLIALQETDNTLYGNNVISKFFCGFANWFGHLMSDIAGSESSRIKGNRGMGIPSPIWSWINSVIAIKRTLNIPVSQFEKELAKTAQYVFLKGGDFRFTATQSIPVTLNELIVKLFYSIRRYIAIRKSDAFGEISRKEIWAKCKPHNSTTLARMLLVAHSTFFVIDVADALIRGSGNAAAVILRINIVGVSRLSVCIYKEFKFQYQLHEAKFQAELAQIEKNVLEDHIRELKRLSEFYNEDNFIDFEKFLAETNDARLTFIKSGKIIMKRGGNNPLQDKPDIDNYFNPPKN